MRAGLSLVLLAVCLSGCDRGPSPMPLTTSSDEARAHFQTGISHFNRQQMTPAMAAFGDALTADPDFALAHGYQALSMNYTGDVEGHWQRAAATIEGASEVEKLWLEALTAWGRQDYPAARDTLSQVIGALPESAQAQFELGWFHYKSRDFDAAEQAMSRAIAIDDTFAPAHVRLAETRLAAGDTDGALEAIHRAVELEPLSARALTVQADILRNRGQIDDAIRGYDEALGADSDFVPALDGRAASFRIAENHSSAIEAYRDLCDATQALGDGAYKELYLDWIKAEDVCFDYGMTHLLAGDPEQAAQVFEATADYTYETRLDNAPIFYNALARLYLEQGRYDVAAATYDRSLAISREPDLSPFMRQLWDGRYLHAQARIKARQGRFDEALSMAAQMKERIDESGDQAERFLPAYHYLMGYILVEQEAFEDAIEHLQQSQLGDPFNRWLLARAHDGAGSTDRAKEIAVELAALPPGSYGHALVLENVREWLAKNGDTVTASSSPMARLPENEAGALVRRAIAYASDSFEAWAAKKSVSYIKTTKYFDAAGNLERTVSEKHQYLLSPTIKVRMERQEAGKTVVLINNGEQAWKYADGALATAQADKDQAWNSTFGSHYVFSMPFKLTDPGAIFTRVGRAELPDGSSADELVVDYEKGAGSSGGYHTWTYFFSPEDARLVANHLKYGPQPIEQSFSTYADHRTIDGIRMPTRRLAWGYDDDGVLSHQQTEITYTDVRFDADLGNELFQPMP